MFVTNLVLNVEREQIFKESLDNLNDNEENELEKDTVSRKSYNSSTTDSETRERLRVYATISPNQSAFKNFFKDLIYKYEETAGLIIAFDFEMYIFFNNSFFSLLELKRKNTNSFAWAAIQSILWDTCLWVKSLWEAIAWEHYFGRRSH